MMIGAIYPNPSNGIFTIQTSNSYTQTLSFEVNNVMGEIVYSSTLPYERDVLLDLSYRSKGIYFIHFFSENNSMIANKKLIIQ
jgi:hypothetical protein